MEYTSSQWTSLQNKSSSIGSFLTTVMCETCHCDHTERLQDHANGASEELLFTSDARKLGR